MTQIKQIKDSDVDFKSLVDEIWDKYDDDGSDELSKDEAYKFILEILANLWDDDKVTSISQEAFEEVFAVIDVDGSATIDRDEMVDFLQQLAQMEDNVGQMMDKRKKEK